MPSEDIVVIDGPHPTSAFWAAHEASRLIGLRTSGTTGASRVVVRTTASWADSFAPLAAEIGLTSSARFWVPGPMNSTMNLFAACLCECLGARWSARPDGADWVTLTPAGLARLLSTHPPMSVIVAGDTLPRPLRDRAAGLGWRVLHYYGAAELSLVALGTCADDLRPFAGVEIDVAEDRLWVRSPWLSRGYLDGEAGSLAWRDDGFASVGDLGSFDGDRLDVWGRGGGITTGGATVALASIQAALAPHVTGAFALVGVPHPELGHVLGIVITDPSDLEPIRRWARKNLSPPQRPRRWLVLPELPLTPAGKVDSAALTSQFLTRR